MQEKIFCRSSLERSWQECRAANVRAENIATVPLIFIVSYNNWHTAAPPWRKAWCPLHNSYENMALQGDGFLVTACGCRLEGICCEGVQRNMLAPWEERDCTIRYRLRYDEQAGNILIMSDSATMYLGTDLQPHLKDYFSNFTVIDCQEMIAKKMRKLPCSLPALIEKAVLTILRQKLGTCWPAWEGPLPKQSRRALPGCPAAKQDTRLVAERRDRLILTLDEQGFARDNLPLLAEGSRYECQICGWQFRQIRSSWHLRNMKHLYWPFFKDAPRSDSMYFVLERNGKYLSFISLRQGKAQKSITCSSDILLDAKLNLVYDAWLQHFGLEADYPSLFSGCRTDFPVQPFEIDTRLASMSLRQLLSLPQNDLPHGYYLQLLRKFADLHLRRRRPPQQPEAEKDLLLENFPYGKRIYEAAVAGNPEAQYALGRLYQELLPDILYSRGREWRQQARQNGWQGLKPDEDIDLLDALPALEAEELQRIV